MGIVRRFTSTVSSSFDWVITQIENHEALVGAAIRDAQGAVAKARAQLQRVKGDGQRLRERLSEAQTNMELWQDRAIRIAKTDQERAIECLRRKKACIGKCLEIFKFYFRAVWVVNIQCENKNGLGYVRLGFIHFHGSPFYTYSLNGLLFSSK